jgi:glutamate synthase domain-containing protein 3
MVELQELDTLDIELLRKLIHAHEEKTVSARARTILVRWDDYLPLFRKVVAKGAGALAEATIRKQLEPVQPDAEPALARRTA